MYRLTQTSPTQRTGGRWLTLLLALLLAIVTMSSHGAMENHQVDCGATAEWMLDNGHSVDGRSGDSQSVEHDHNASSCVTCTTAMSQTRLLVLGPERLANSPAMALSPQFPLTPRRPPRT
ncbi:DUF2946 family protein [Halomonas alkaliantarctica]|uniref:DUF2946 family protein n=1 Tax=Halomonas alkaliantarctica TaxID=232346 RepID=UPI00265AE16A|nr:DUF2946 family protein [Halomonas alkaliantarctica]